MMEGKLTLNMPGIVVAATSLRWSAERLAQSFHNMPVEVAQGLLDGELAIDNNGKVVEVAA